LQSKLRSDKFNNNNNNNKLALLIYIAIPDDSYVNTQGTDKLSQFKDVEIQVSRMWKVST